VVREHHDLHARQRLLDQRDRVDSGQAGHRDVEQDHVGTDLADEPDALARVPAVPHDLEPRVAREQALEARAQHRLVVDEKDADRMLRVDGSGRSSRVQVGVTPVHDVIVGVCAGAGDAHKCAVDRAKREQPRSQLARIERCAVRRIPGGSARA
jgi:hypothetical protein